MAESAPLADEPSSPEVVATSTPFAGRIWDVRREQVRLPHGQTVTRDVIIHPGAVGVIALDDQDRVLLVRQYRHPVGMYLWEPPAGLLDLPGEDPLLTAQRELVEEAGLVAQSWWVLADWFNSPGGSSEGFRCYLARGISPAPQGRPVGDAEEYDMPMRWVPLDDVVAGILAGGLHNPLTVAGCLAARAARDAGWEPLRHAQAPWPAREHLQSGGRVYDPGAGR